MTASCFRTLTVAVSCTLAACSGGGSDPTDPVTETPTEYPTDDGGMPTPTDRVTPMPTPTPTDHPTPPPTTCLENGMCVSHPEVSTAMFRFADWDTVTGIDHLGTCDGSGCRWCEDDPQWCEGDIFRTNEPYRVREPACDGPVGTGCLYLRTLGVIPGNITIRSPAQAIAPRTFRYAFVELLDPATSTTREIATVDVPPEGTLITGIPTDATYLIEDRVTEMGGSWLHVRELNPGFAWPLEGLFTRSPEKFTITSGATTGFVLQLDATSDALSWAPGQWRILDAIPQCPERTNARVEPPTECTPMGDSSCPWSVFGFCPYDVLWTNHPDECGSWNVCNADSGNPSFVLSHGGLHCMRLDRVGNALPTEPADADQRLVLTLYAEDDTQVRYVLEQSASDTRTSCAPRE